MSKKRNVKKPGLIDGRYTATDKGYGFFIPDAGGPDYFIPPRQSGGAWHGDRVSIISTGDPEGKGPTGRVVTILERGTSELTGKLVRTRQEAYIEPDDRRLPGRLEVNRASLKASFRDGDKIALNVTSFGDKRLPSGDVTANLGQDGTFEAAVEAQLHTHGIRRRFSPRTMSQVRGITDNVPEEAYQGRTDLREMLIFTIDGADAKDLDDAVSLTKDDQGRRVLGVHIADVSQYVTLDSPVDTDAFNRGTSVYFADQVVPMLPKELSNGICSLHGGVDRLCLSAFMTLDTDGVTVDTELRQTVIKSKARMTYQDCNGILEKDTVLIEKYSFLASTLQEMNALAKQMTTLRTAKGALNLDTVESSIVCDEKGFPVGVEARPRGDSEKMIEAFMLAANEAVANQLFWSEEPCVYRIHQSPNPLKLEEFYALALIKGLPVKKSKTVTGGSLQAVLDAAASLPASRVIHNALLRSMMKAQYSAENVGHFGLASACYCHFTSPIRRYPDLMVHRCIKAHMGWNDKAEGWKARLTDAAAQSTDRELETDMAERSIEKLYKALYMQKSVGETFEGIISGVQSYGFYVELPDTIEGLVSVHTLHGDLYRVDDTGLSLVGEVTHTKYDVGDPVTILCVHSDPLTGRIDFELV